MKRTDLAKQQGIKINNKIKQANIPDRFGAAASAPLSRREQRQQEQAQGLVPFAVKLDAGLVQQLHALAQRRQTGLNELVGALLAQSLAALPAAD
jgi:hypothetical protein